MVKKTAVAITLIFLLAAGLFPSAFSFADSDKDKSDRTYEPGASAQADIGLLVKAGILKKSIYKKSFKKDITAKELNKVLASLQEFMSGDAGGDGAGSADDGAGASVITGAGVTAGTAAEAATAAAVVNRRITNSKGKIVSGVEKGEVMGALSVAVMNSDPAAWADTRTEFFEFLADNASAVRSYAVNGTQAPQVISAADAGAEVAYAVVDPNEGITREDFFLLVSRLVWQFERSRMAEVAPVPETPGIYNYSGEEFYGKDVYLYWEPVAGAAGYIVRIYNGDGKLKKKITVTGTVLNITEESKPAFKSVFGKKKDKDYEASFTVQAVSEHGIRSGKSDKVSFTAVKYDSFRERYGKNAITYKSGKSGGKHQALVVLNVWRDVGGEKVPATVRFQVHEKVARDVAQIFGEYFTGQERFPIQSIGGYAVRNKRSEHNYGTAIDINPDQNYMVGPKGITAGHYWAPGEDPYSIPDDSELVKAFERHGWYWAGNGWGRTYDYMHFSLQGT